MEFRRRKAKGRSRETYKEWVSDCGFFRINWTNEWGYKHYHACVKVENGVEGFRWDFAYRRGPHKTYKKAVESCEKSKRLWDAFIKLSHSPGRRDGKLLELKCRAPMVFFNLPLFVREQADPSLIRMLLCPTKDQSDPTETSETTLPESSSFSPRQNDSTIPSGPASPAPAEVGITTLTIETLSKDTSSPLDTPAPPATKPAVARKKRSKPSTTPPSPSIEPPSPPGKKRKSTAKAASPNSPKKRKAA